jgi:hypothetical protein
MSDIKRGNLILIVQKWLILMIRGIFKDNKQVLIVPLHQVFFPGIFFQRAGVSLHFIQYRLFLSYLICVVLFALKQVMQLPVPFYPCKDIVLIKKKNDRCKHSYSDKKFTFYPGGYVG